MANNPNLVPKVPYGCVLFDDEEGKIGWACNSLGELQRISSIGTLSNTHIWISNLNYEEMYRAGYQHHAKIKQQAFLGRPLAEILRCYGLINPISNFFTKEAQLKEVKGKELTIHLAKIVNRVASLSETFFGLKTDAAGAGHTLPKMFGHQFSQKSYVEQGVKNRLDNATQRTTRTGELTSKEQDKLVKLYISGRQHLLTLMKKLLLPAPKTEWQLIKNCHSITDITSEYPCALIRIDLSGMPEIWQNILNFGTAHGGAGRKLWVTTLDLIFLQESVIDDGIIKIIEVYAPQSYFQARNLLKNADTNTSWTTIKGGDISTSFSIAATAFWLGLTNPPITSNPLHAATYTPFVHSVDRVLCLGVVLKLKKFAGSFDKTIKITQFGRGSIEIVDNDYSAEEWLAIARAGELEAPVLYDPAMRKLTSEIDKEDELDVCRAIHLLGGADGVLAADEKSFSQMISQIKK